jgi:diguanylate cyclase (GGDEF)-like protein
MIEPIKPKPVAWHRDVLALVPLTDDFFHLEGVWRLHGGSSPLERLRLWQPADEIDRENRRFLLDFGSQVLAAERSVLKELAFKDEVTGLYNRRFFSTRLEEEVARHRKSSHPVSVVLAELDGVEAISNELGRAARDETLRGMAEVLLRHTRGINVVARYDGSLFAVVLVETSKAGARLYADYIRYVLSSFQFPHHRRVTASFGIASLPEDVGPAAEELMRAADEALRAARRASKNPVGAREVRTPRPPRTKTP